MSMRSEARPSPAAWLQYFAILAALLVVISMGYFGFRAFAGAADLSALNLYALALVAGVASFFSPCAFPLLPSYFSFYHELQDEARTPEDRRPGALKLGLATALGVVTFDLALGLVIAGLGAGAGKWLSISGPDPNQFVRVFRGVVGGLLLLLGIAQLRGWNLKPIFVDAFAYRTRPEREGRRSPAFNLYLYGLGYNAAGMGCTGPILAGLVVLALSSGGFGSALGAFVVFSLTMGLLALIVSGLVAASRHTLIAKIKAAGPRIRSTSAILLVLVGVFNLYTSFDLASFVRVLFP